MNSVTQVIAHFFLLSMAFGTQMFAPVVSTKLTGVGFYKLTTSIVLVSLVLAFGVDFYMAPGLSTIDYASYGILILTHSLGYVFHRDQKTPLMWALYVIQTLVFSAYVFHVFAGQLHWVPFFITSMLFFGISNYSMLLGHYYLVVPKLTEEPLIYCMYIFWTILFVKLMGSLTVIFTSGVPFLEEGSQVGDGYMYNWLFVTMRYLWGYVAPFVLSLFTFRLCRLRSIQSATGVLYIIEFFVIVGELVSIYIMTKYGLAL